MSRCRLAVMISLIGVVLPWPGSAFARGDGQPSAASAARPSDAAVRSVFGFDERDATPSEARGRAATTTPGREPAGPQSHIAGDRRWEAAALGLRRASTRPQGSEAGSAVAAGHPVADAASQFERIRSVLGLEPQAAVASSTPVRGVPAGPVQRSGAKPAVRPRANHEEPIATPRAIGVDETNVGVECVGSACVWPSDAEVDVQDVARTAVDAPAPRPERKREQPGPVLAEAWAPPFRRGNAPVPNTLVLPPDDDGPVAANAHAGQSTPGDARDDPLLSLLAILPAGEPPDRSVTPDADRLARANDTPAPMVSSVVFERMAREIQGLSELALDVVEVDPRLGLGAIGSTTVAATAERRFVEPEPGTEDGGLAATTLQRPTGPIDLAIIGNYDRLHVLLMNERLESPAEPGEFRVATVDLLLPIPLPASAPPRLLVLPRLRLVESAPVREQVLADAFFPTSTEALSGRRSGNPVRPGVGDAPPRASASLDAFDTDRELPRGAPEESSRTHAASDDVRRAAAPAATIVPIAREPEAPRSGPSIGTPRPHPLDGILVAIDDSRLDTMRGGFETDAGLRISFGIERAVYINGSLVTTTSLNVADLSRLTAGQAPPSGLDRATVGLIQTGPNNTFVPGQVSSSSVATVIQNSLNNQLIQGTTQINATVNSLDLIRKSDVQADIQGALAGSIRR